MKTVFFKIIEWLIAFYVRRRPDNTYKEIDELKERIDEIEIEMANSQSSDDINRLSAERVRINKRIATLNSRFGKSVSIKVR